MDEISCRESVTAQLKGWHILIGLSQFAVHWLFFFLFF